MLRAAEVKNAAKAVREAVIRVAYMQNVSPTVLTQAVYCDGKIMLMPPDEDECLVFFPSKARQNTAISSAEWLQNYLIIKFFVESRKIMILSLKGSILVHNRHFPRPNLEHIEYLLRVKVVLTLLSHFGMIDC